MSLEDYRGALNDLKEQLLFFSLTINPGSRYSANDAAQVWSRYPGQIFLLEERLLGVEEDVAAFLTALGYADRKNSQTINDAVNIANYVVRNDFRDEAAAQRRLQERQYLYYGQIKGHTVHDLLPVPPRKAIPLTERLAQLEPQQYLNVSNYVREKGTGVAGPRPYPSGRVLRAIYPGDGGVTTVALPLVSNNLRGYLDAISSIPNARQEHAQEIATFISFFDTTGTKK
jgi:hypothetical protein